MFRHLRVATSRLLLSATLALGALAPAGAASPRLDPVPILESWLLPRYDALATAAAHQSTAWATFCTKPESAGLPALKEAYEQTADAWNAVEFVTFGPITLSLRADRISFFPDRRNAIARGLAEIIGDGDAARLEPERFAQSSAAVQGLPALERLLFEEGAADALVTGPEAARRCALGTAIAANLASITRDVRTAWGDRTSGVLGAIVSGKGDPALFPDLGALPGMILTDLSGAYQRVSDTKILPVLGTGPSDARPTLADNWRSGRSGRVAANMIRSSDALLLAVGAQLPSRPQYVLGKAATAANAAAEKIPADMGTAAGTAEGAATLHAAIKTFKTAQATVYKPTAAYFGISLGFNALDGD